MCQTRFIILATSILIPFFFNSVMEIVETLLIALPSALAAIGLYLTIRHRRQDKKESESPFGRRVANAD